MESLTIFFYNSSETVVIISSIVDSTKSTIRIGNTVVTLNYVSITFFMLGFMVSSMWVVNSIAELVFGVGLKAF